MMSNKTFKIFVDKMGGTNPFNYIGVTGDISYDPDTGELRLSDGATLRGSAVRPVSIFAQLSSNTSQLAVNTNATLITYDSEEALSGISHTVGNSRITIQSNGTYMFIIGGQVAMSGGGAQKNVDYWLRKGGVDVVNSGIRLSLLNANDTDVLILNYALNLVANDYVELVQAADSGSVGIGLTRLTAFAGGPNIPAVIVSVWKI